MYICNFRFFGLHMYIAKNHKKKHNVNMNTNPIQAEIVKALEQLSEKATFTEAILAKKIRENNKIDGKKKAGVALNDLMSAVDELEEKQIFYSIHINSVNEILLKKETEHKDFDIEQKRRRQNSEKSMSILTSGDLKSGGSKTSNGKKNQKRNDRKSIRINANFEDWE